ncbi:Lacal_2735 family protein [Adhaeretor mobilis]|uniref:Lacal_2735 family protein n=1 Tax=Adhaeretor mobilis TaxID=1930276 RepID=A0A517MPT0_9BACT|nr:Lacal_2735 family protein [Adhaeretor mobilis]QDS96879.1 hypothetical protein HG15A2_01380 [Adhaeretor mobilis]
MFGLFADRKTKLEKKHAKLLEESYRLSHVHRKESDLKAAEAEAILTQIKALEDDAQS